MLQRDLQHIGTKTERTLRPAEEGATREGEQKPMPQPPLVVAMCRADAMATKGCERAMGHDKKMSAAEEVLYFRTKICEKKYNSSKGQCRVRYGIQDV